MQDNCGALNRGQRSTDLQEKYLHTSEEMVFFEDALLLLTDDSLAFYAIPVAIPISYSKRPTVAVSNSAGRYVIEDAFRVG
jgi:hypothetical protein